MSPAEIILVLLAAGTGLLLGSVVHELSHYAVLRISGHDPTLLWPQLDASRLQFRVEYEHPTSVTPITVRLAAVAPVAGGLVLAAGLLISGVTSSAAGLAFTVGSVIWALKLSPQDRAVVRGDL
jgi:hypothetical protein